MKKIFCFTAAAFLAFLITACDGGSSTGTIEVTVTNETTDVGVVFVGVFDSVDSLMAQDLPLYSNDASGDAITASGDTGDSVVITLSDVPVGTYYVTGILETDAPESGADFGDPCSSELAWYFINDGQTYLGIFSDQSSVTGIVVEKGKTTAVTGTFGDNKIPSQACSQ